MISLNQNKKTSSTQKGQAVLLVLFSLSIALLAVLFSFSRSNMDLSLSTKDEDAMRAFSAAEAGIEQALIIGSNVSDSDYNGGSFNAQVSQFAQAENGVIYPLNLKSGETAFFWLKRTGDATSFTGNSIKVCWGQAGTPTAENSTPAIGVSVFYGNRIARVYLDPKTGRTSNVGIPNYFSNAGTDGCTVKGESFQFYKNIILSNLGVNAAWGTPSFMIVKLFYNTNTGHKVAIDVSGSGLLPAQGILVKSSGSFSEANRAVEVNQLYPSVPSIFTNVIYSSNGIIK